MSVNLHVGIATAQGMLFPKSPRSRPDSRRIGQLLLRQRFSQIRTLTYGELAMLDSIATHQTEWRASETLLSDTIPLTSPRVIMSGWACRRLYLADGRRQIFGFLIPGDIVFPDCEKRMLGSIVTMTRVWTSNLPAVDAKSSFYMEGGICALALAAAALQRERLLTQHILRLGSMQASERVQHLLLELCERFTEIGLFDGRNLSFPLSQETVADALGMSTVHVNRVFKRLRLDGVLQYGTRHTLLIDVQKLKGAAP